MCFSANFNAVWFPIELCEHQHNLVKMDNFSTKIYLKQITHINNVNKIAVESVFDITFGIFARIVQLP